MINALQKLLSTFVAVGLVVLAITGTDVAAAIQSLTH